MLRYHAVTSQLFDNSMSLSFLQQFTRYIAAIPVAPKLRYQANCLDWASLLLSTRRVSCTLFLAVGQVVPFFFSQISLIAYLGVHRFS